MKQLLACADRLGGVAALRKLAWDSYDSKVSLSIPYSEEGLQELLELKEAMGAVASTDAKVLNAKEVLEQKIVECQEELPKVIALLEQAQDKSWQERDKIRAPFEKSADSLQADIKALLEACDASLGVAVVRQVLGVKKAKYTRNYNELGFKTALEKEVLKPLEEYFKALGLVAEPKCALGVLQAELQKNIAQIQETLAEIEQTHQALVKEGIVTDKETKVLYNSLDQGLESLKASLKTFVASNGYENIVKMGKEALRHVGYVGELDEALLKASGANSPQSASMDLAQTRAFLEERLHTELKRNNICEHLGKHLRNF
ncbi:hypothetical protein [Helicobacter salomonis]|uniref:hypothetical protein n=1 Tax=Helicobacter salomonis TaxID=56878 RepID=UPI0013159A33|nr:hypothetical protein [Helicobacter salomonis]